MIQSFFKHHRLKGFTILELMVALTVLTLLALFAGRVYLNYMAITRDLKAANLVYEEARFLMEKIVREVRQNAIDYEEYFNQNVQIPMDGTGTYGDNYCDYNSFFYSSGPDSDFTTLEDNESTGLRNPDYEADIIAASFDPAAIRSVEDELYLINISGNRRTILTRIERDINGNTIGKVAVTRLIGADYGDDKINAADPRGSGTEPGCDPDARENDGLIDTWLCDPDYPCKTDVALTSPACNDGYGHLILNDPTDDDHSFIDISPNALNIVDLQFMISPEDDPWKAYNINDIQIQPHVTIQLTVEANPIIAGTSNPDRLPHITLTSTITTRNYDEIKSPCN